MILLDSHVLAWFFLGIDKLGRHANALAARHASRRSVLVSPLSFYELDIASERKMLKGFNGSRVLRQRLLDAGCAEVLVDGNICARAAELRHAFIDPFDALMVATADVHGMTLLTADERILAWKGRVKRIDARK